MLDWTCCSAVDEMMRWHDGSNFLLLLLILLLMLNPSTHTDTVKMFSTYTQPNESNCCFHFTDYLNVVFFYAVTTSNTNERNAIEVATPCYSLPTTGCCLVVNTHTVTTSNNHEQCDWMKTIVEKLIHTNDCITCSAAYCSVPSRDKD